MSIIPIKLIPTVNSGSVDSEDLLRRPKTHAPKAESPVQRAAVEIAYQNRKIFFAGRNIADVISEANQSNPQLLCKIANQLEKFKSDRLKYARHLKKQGLLTAQEAKDIAQSQALCDTLLAKIGGNFKSRYDETKSGVRLHADEDGQLILNGMNIHMFVENCRDNPTPKARAFLKGLRARLIYALNSRADAYDFERLCSMIRAVLDDIDNLLRGAPAAPSES